MAARKDHGQKEVQKRVDAEQEKGYFGDEVDPTPNANYTVAGVVAGKPTPETDPKQREKANETTRRRRNR